MSGVGKSTLLVELAQRGHLTVDTDYGSWDLPDRMWDEHAMGTLLAQNPDIVVSGTAENQVRFYDRFEHVILLSAPLDVLLDRVENRTNNPYGKTQAQRDEVKHYLATVEPLLRRGATLELDGQSPVSDLADIVERMLSNSPDS
jgi:shikimate kinase